MQIVKAFNGYLGVEMPSRLYHLISFFTLKMMLQHTISWQ